MSHYPDNEKFWVPVSGDLIAAALRLEKTSVKAPKPEKKK